MNEESRYENRVIELWLDKKINTLTIKCHIDLKRFYGDKRRITV